MRGVIRSDVDASLCSARALAFVKAQEELFNARARGERQDEPMVLYSLVSGENGGANPLASTPATLVRGRQYCDCVGFASWCRGFDRWQPVHFNHFYGGYINTDSMLMDVLSERVVTGTGSTRIYRRMFRPVEHARPGIFIVYPSMFVAGRKAKGSWGHIGVVVDVAPGWDDATPDWSKLTVAHCHGGQSGRLIRAVELGNGVIWGHTGRAHLTELVTQA